MKFRPHQVPDDLYPVSECRTCDGTGDCEYCYGEGKDHCDDPCEHCRGSGMCIDCHGFGEVVN